MQAEALQTTKWNQYHFFNLNLLQLVFKKIMTELVELNYFKKSSKPSKLIKHSDANHKRQKIAKC